eukprot:Platyproteum_vivax@DN11404_c0_g1_i1.p1
MDVQARIRKKEKVKNEQDHLAVKTEQITVKKQLLQIKTDEKITGIIQESTVKNVQDDVMESVEIKVIQPLQCISVQTPKDNLQSHKNAHVTERMRLILQRN